MIRTSVLAAVLAAGLALPALAENNANVVFTEDQARQHLLHLGYTNVSDLVRDEKGNWTGTAEKDGNSVPVAVGIKVAPTDN
jgi:hypothetical protein